MTWGHVRGHVRVPIFNQPIGDKPTNVKTLRGGVPLVNK